MDSHEIEMAQLCVEMAESATGQERRILLDLADKWLAKAARARDSQWLAAQVHVLKHPH